MAIKIFTFLRSLGTERNEMERSPPAIYNERFFFMMMGKEEILFIGIYD